MAKPIRATPTLSGAEAIQFVKTMRQAEVNPRLTQLDKELQKIIEQNKKLFTV